MCFKILLLVFFKVLLCILILKLFILLEIGVELIVDLSLLCFVIHGFDNEPGKFVNMCGGVVKPHDRF
jgi:hypothetical protein